uniref:NADH dehydrogenase subunit 6 n=1 Tax=Carpophilus pilosellus TaxID=2704548 RepID=UPI0013E94509|nr:NADH dehydrogenase subunit 6 [Carpophilus pilosellus]QHR79652.1 NADH dehydrogenase subunit 6 [Carpophilus pilosellus]
MNFLLNMIILMSIIFLFLNHPLSMGFILLIQTIFTALITGMMNYNFWYSYILFLVMIGGMLILFIYMTSIASNKKFKFSIKLFSFMIILFLMLSLYMIIIDQYMYYNEYLNYDITIFNNYYDNKISLNKFINNPNFMILMMIFIYLLITLIAVAKIAPLKKGSLRQKF